ncbi:hypothetical protein NPS70_16810 [Streptomyces sp. C10-9-1]|uniref:hypothetical protein n=1 Tax=Streptomyces sp. C10-9-1 TaxID=1859285 RepID=UPI002111395E|nr:hypothetical protein [Streptomyces sp. C10-9-1]MCQ6554840.1 hypothetical protein [Streptomyces sp. C10-9-1]
MSAARTIRSSVARCTATFSSDRRTSPPVDVQWCTSTSRPLRTAAARPAAWWAGSTATRRTRCPGLSSASGRASAVGASPVTVTVMPT